MLIEGKNLFPLELVGNYKGYYMDAECALYSTKRGTLSRVFGSTSSGGYRSERRYTLNGISYTESWLRRVAMAHSSFGTETKTVITAKSIGAELPKAAGDVRAHAPNLEAGIKAKGYMIGTLQNGMISFAKVPAVHTTEGSAKSEAERLARELPGTKFIYVKVMGSAMAGGVTWE